MCERVQPLAWWLVPLVPPALAAAGGGGVVCCDPVDPLFVLWSKWIQEENLLGFSVPPSLLFLLGGFGGMSASPWGHLAKGSPSRAVVWGLWRCVTRLRGDERRSLVSCDLLCTSDESVLSRPQPKLMPCRAV